MALRRYTNLIIIIIIIIISKNQVIGLSCVYFED